ncbi:uncharacterized protein LOC124159033 isoform X2 [Ischnura elegans]|uniref:uncharacterized protein LOC124159033 isoform X2 n=1 Tax=Ischnura elegans TaxID=197161 RepID=UPI001ED8B122|nr:uncharacterized protein LOC124159033 isoform X2 [Ischnura elegans]
MGAVNAKDVNKPAESKSDEGCKEESTSHGGEKKDDGSPQVISQDKMPPKCPKTGGILGFPVSKVVFSIGTIDAEDTREQEKKEKQQREMENRQKEKEEKPIESENTTPILSRLNIKRMLDDKVKKGKESNTKSGRKNVQKHEVSVQTDDEVNKCSKTRIKELRIRIADSSEDNLNTPLSIMWVKEKDSRGQIHYRRCKTWSDSDVSRWTDGSDIMFQGKKTKQSTHGLVLSGMKNTAINSTRRVKFTGDNSEAESEAESRDSDGKSKWSMSPRKSNWSLDLPECLKRKIKRVASIRLFSAQPPRSDDEDSDYSSVVMENDREEEENKGRSSERKMQMARVAEGNSMKSSTQDDKSERSQENPKQIEEARSTEYDVESKNTRGKVNQKLRERCCSDMGINSEKNFEGSHSTINSGSKNEERINGLKANGESAKRNFAPRTSMEGNEEETDEEYKRGEKEGTNFQIIPKDDKRSSESEGRRSYKSSEEENKEIPGSQRNFSDKIDQNQPDSESQEQETNVENERDSRLGDEPHKDASRHESGIGQSSTKEVGQFDIRDQSVMALFNIEYFLRSKYSTTNTIGKKCGASAINERENIARRPKIPYSIFKKDEYILKEEKYDEIKTDGKNFRENSTFNQNHQDLRSRNDFHENFLNNHVERQNFPTYAESLDKKCSINKCEGGDTMNALTRNESNASSTVDAETMQKLPQFTDPWSPKITPKKKGNIFDNPLTITSPPVYSRKCVNHKFHAHASKSVMVRELNEGKGNKLTSTNCFSDSETFDRIKRRRQINQERRRGEGTRKGNRYQEYPRGGNIIERNSTRESQSNQGIENTRETSTSFNVQSHNLEREKEISTDTYKDELKSIKINTQSCSWDAVHKVHNWQNQCEKKTLPAESSRYKDVCTYGKETATSTKNFTQNNFFQKKSKSEPSYDRSSDSQKNTRENRIWTTYNEDKSMTATCNVHNALSDSKNFPRWSWKEDENLEEKIKKAEKVNGHESNVETWMTTENQEHGTETFPRAHEGDGRVYNQEKSSQINKLDLEMKNRQVTNYCGNKATRERRNSFLTFASLISAGKNQTPKNNTKIDSKRGLMKKGRINVSMQCRDRKGSFPSTSTSKSPGATASDFTKAHTKNYLERANTNSDDGASSTSINSSTQNKQGTQASQKDGTKYNEGLHSKSPSSLLKTDYAINDEGFSQLKRPSNSKVSYNSTSAIVNDGAPIVEKKSNPITRTSMIPRLVHQHESPMDKDVKHAKDATQDAGSTTSSAEARKIPPIMKKRTQFSQVGYSKQGNKAIQCTPHRVNINRRNNKQTKPVNRVQNPETAKNYEKRNHSLSRDHGVIMKTMINKELERDMKLSRQSKPTDSIHGESSHNDINRPYIGEQTHKVTGKPPICAAPRKQRDLELFPSGLGVTQAAIKKVEEWQVLGAAVDGYSEGYEQTNERKTRKEGESSKSVMESIITSNQKAVSTGDGAECFNFARRTSLEGCGNQSKEYPKRDKLHMNNSRGMEEEISLTNDSLESQSSKEGTSTVKSMKMSMRAVSCKLSKLIENVSKLKLLHGNRAESKSLKVDSNVDTLSIGEISGWQNEEDGLRPEGSEALSVQFLHKPRPLSFSLTARSNTNTHGHSDESTSDGTGAAGELSTTSGEISIRTAQRLQGQIDVLMEKFLTLLDNVERMQEEHVKKTGREERDGEREMKVKRGAGGKDSPQGNAEVSQMMTISGSLPYQGMTGMLTSREPTKTQETAECKRRFTRNREMALYEISNSSKLVRKESKSGSSSSSTWSKMRTRSENYGSSCEDESASHIMLLST